MMAMLRRWYCWMFPPGEYFVCAVCQRSLPVEFRDCLDPPLCHVCVDHDNAQEYKLTFGDE